MEASVPRYPRGIPVPSGPEAERERCPAIGGTAPPQPSFRRQIGRPEPGRP